MDDKLIVGQRHRDAAAWALSRGYGQSFEQMTEAHVTPDRLWQMNRAAEAFARFERDHMPAATPTPVSAAVEERARGMLATMRRQGSWDPDVIKAIETALTNAQPIRAGVQTYVGCQQARGRLPDLIDEALEIYDDFMKDDDNDCWRCLDKVVQKLRGAKDWYPPLATPDDALTERASVIEECVQAAKSATLPADYIWSQGNIKKFEFGVETAVAAISALLTRAPGQGEGK